MNRYGDTELAKKDQRRIRGIAKFQFVGDPKDADEMIDFKFVIPLGHKDISLEVVSVELMVIDSQLCRCSAVEGVKEFGVCEKHRLLILLTRHEVVYIFKLERLCISVSYFEYAVLIHSRYGNVVVC